MKQIFTGLRLLGAFALLLVNFCGCASTEVQTKESRLSEAGFHVRTPSTQLQLALCSKMTPYKLERNSIKGKAIYTYFDTQRNVVYIGGDKAYQQYRNIALQHAIAEQEIEASYSAYLKHLDQAWSENFE